MPLKRPAADASLNGPPVQGPSFAQAQQMAPPPAEPDYVPRDRPKTFRYDLVFLKRILAFSQAHDIPQNQILQQAANQWMDEYEQKHGRGA